MDIDLNRVVPAWLALEPGLHDILKAVNAIRPDQWQRRLADVLDFAYRVRFVRVMMNHPSTEEMEELALHLEDVADDPVRAAKLDSLEKPYASRWRMLRNVLEDRLAVRELAVPELIVKRLRPILKKIRKAGCLSQQQFLDSVDLVKVDKSRTISLLENWELVTRDKMAKEQWFFLGPRAGEVIGLAVIPETEVDAPPKLRAGPGHAGLDHRFGHEAPENYGASIDNDNLQLVGDSTPMARHRLAETMIKAGRASFDSSVLDQSKAKPNGKRGVLEGAESIRVDHTLVAA